MQILIVKYLSLKTFCGFCILFDKRNFMSLWDFFEFLSLFNFEIQMLFKHETFLLG